MTSFCCFAVQTFTDVQLFFNLFSQLISKAQLLPSVAAEPPECPIAFGTYILDKDFSEISEIRLPCLDIVLVFLDRVFNLS